MKDSLDIIFRQAGHNFWVDYNLRDLECNILELLAKSTHQYQIELEPNLQTFTSGIFFLSLFS